MQQRIFVMRGLSAAQMPFRLVHVQNVPYKSPKSGIDRFQTFRYVLMYRAFSDAQRFCGVAYRRFTINDISCFLADPVFVPTQRKIPPFAYC